MVPMYSSFYQEWLGKNLTEKYSSLSSKMDKVIEEANSEIGALQNKISGRSAQPPCIFISAD